MATSSRSSAGGVSIRGQGLALSRPGDGVLEAWRRRGLSEDPGGRKAKRFKPKIVEIGVEIGR